MAHAASVVLAHGSGIDDVLWFAVPVILGVTIVRMAEKRARSKARDQEEAGDLRDGP